MTNVPTALKYVPAHHWITEIAPIIVRVGVTDFAQESLSDVIAIDLPKLGSAVKAGSPCGEIESAKNVSDLVAPLTGKISALNQRLEAEPELTNSDPYGDGWLFEVEADHDTYAIQTATLLNADQYRHLIEK